MSRKSGALTYQEPLGPPRPVVGDLYLFTLFQPLTNINILQSVRKVTVQAHSTVPYTKTTADAHNTPALFLQQSVPTLVLRDHTRPILLGLTLLNNHRGINNDTVTFRTPCIICICYTFRGCNIRSCILTFRNRESYL